MPDYGFKKEKADYPERAGFPDKKGNYYFTILPLKGIQWDGQSIFLGEKKMDIESKLGISQNVRDNSYYYFESNLRFDFSTDGELECIEFLGGIMGNIQPIIFGIQAFQEDADDVFHILKDKNSGEIVDTENGYSYAFPNIGIGVYREQIPDNLPEFIREVQEAGEDILDNPNIKEVQLKAMHWTTIAVTRSNYPWQ